MNEETSAHVFAPVGNLLVVHDDGNISSHSVSQTYGRAILGALALRLNRLPYRVLHHSNLSQHEPLTLDNIRKAAQAIGPRDNFMFINDNREIISCQIYFGHGLALIDRLQQQSLQTASGTQALLPHAMDTQDNDKSNDQDVKMESPPPSSEDLEQRCANTSYFPQNTPNASKEFLSDEILSAANRKPYDRDWMERYNISDDCLNGPASKHRLDVIVKSGALKVGDKLCVTYHPAGGPVVGYGEVRPFRSLHFYPYLTAKIPPFSPLH